MILPLWRGAFRDGRNRELLYSSRPLIDNNDFNQVGVQRLKWTRKPGLGPCYLRIFLCGRLEALTIIITVLVIFAGIAL